MINFVYKNLIWSIDLKYQVFSEISLNLSFISDLKIILETKKTFLHLY